MAASKAPTDWVKIIGIAAAIVLLIGSQSYVSRRSAERRAIFEHEQEERAKASEAAELAAKKERERLIAEGKTAEGKTGEEKTAEAPPSLEAVKTTPAPVNAEKPLKGDPPVAGAHDPAKEIAEAPPVEIAGTHLDLTFAAKGAALRVGKLADYFVEAKSLDPDGKPGVELLEEIEPGRLTLGLAQFTFAGMEYADLESRVWSQVEDSKGFVGSESIWSLAYETTLHHKTTFAPLAKITKRFHVRKEGQGVEVEILVKNLSDKPAVYEFGLRGPAGVLMDGTPEKPRQSASPIRCSIASRKLTEDTPNVSIFYPSASEVPKEKRRVSSEENLWAMVCNGFFTAALVARAPQETIEIVAEPVHKDPRKDKRFHLDNISPVFYRQASEPLAAGATSAANGYVLYMGPYQEGPLAAFEESLDPPLLRPAHLHLAVQYCDVFNSHWPNIDRLARLLLAIFSGIYSLIHSYGLAVILLTLVVKSCLHPIQRKQTISMHKMQLLQPHLKAIEEKYAGQTSPEMKQKKEMEKWDLMRKSGANPLTGCLPMLLQMPIFFALYGTFSHAFEIRQAPFLWIHDLSAPDRLALLNFWPRELNLLPILYIGMTITQTMLQPKPATSDPQQEMNRKMMMFMPLFFGFIIYSMPSGLVLYFAASATFGIVESWYLKKFVLKTDGLAPGKAAEKAPSASPIPGIKPATK